MPPRTRPPAAEAACGGSSNSEGTITRVDYETESGTIQFNPGEISKPIGVAICGEIQDEPNESFRVRLSNAVGATIQEENGRVTIIDDDPTPTPRISATTTEVANDAQADLIVGLSSRSNQTVEVTATVLSGTATVGTGTCGPNVDVVDPVPRRLVFPPLSSGQAFFFRLCGDTVDEQDETFRVVFSNPVNMTLTDSEGLVTIQDDDPPPALSITPLVEIDEPAAGSVPATFTVSVEGCPRTL